MGSDRSECRSVFKRIEKHDKLTPVIEHRAFQSNGANLSFPEAFGIADNEWLIGLINGAPYLASAAM